MRKKQGLDASQYGSEYSRSKANQSKMHDSRSVPKPKSAFHTARTDNMLLEFEEEERNGSPKRITEGDHCSAIDEISESGFEHKMKNVTDRNVATKDHRYVTKRPKDWTDDVLPEN